MVEQRAFFTPPPEDVHKLIARLIYDAHSQKHEISFMVSATDDSDAELPNLKEVTLSPVERICATNTGLEIFGRHSISQKGARLLIDTTVEPPAALYSELEP